jgi:hypothetical protein
MQAGFPSRVSAARPQLTIRRTEPGRCCTEHTEERKKIGALVEILDMKSERLFKTT